MTSEVIIGWITEVSVPFHHTYISRWKVVLVDMMGNNLVHDWHLQTRDEAEAAFMNWVETHPNCSVRLIQEVEPEPQAPVGPNRGDPALSPFHMEDNPCS